MLFLYKLINIILAPIHVILLLVRFFYKKENITSLKSRFAFYKKTKKSENLIWLHAASVGESIAAMRLIDNLRKSYKNFDFLITTGTLSSAAIINKWRPQNVYHEFTPLDNFFLIRKFYKYWQPNLGIFIESDIWPELVSSSYRKCRLLLFNGRISNHSFKKWQKFPRVFQSLISEFSCVAVQSEVDLEKYHSLGCSQAQNLGNLKFTNKKLAVKESDLLFFKEIFANKRIFVASSTHKNDEQVLLEVISQIKNENIESFYPIIILRHPERAAQLSYICKKMGLKHNLRSEKLDHKILSNDLLIVDSFGELGLFYSLAEVTFIGGSFETAKGIGGHNLLEPAYFGNVIIVGPNMSNFQNVTDEMIKNESCLQITSGKELKDQILFLFEEKNLAYRTKYANNAKKYIQTRKKIMTKYLQQIDKFLK